MMQRHRTRPFPIVHSVSRDAYMSDLPHFCLFKCTVSLKHTLPTVLAVSTSEPLDDKLCDNRDHICVISAVMVLGKLSDT